jgi:hypothetical protein
VPASRYPTLTLEFDVIYPATIHEKFHVNRDFVTALDIVTFYQGRGLGQFAVVARILRMVQNNGLVKLIQVHLLLGVLFDTPDKDLAACICIIASPPSARTSISSKGNVVVWMYFDESEIIVSSALIGKTWDKKPSNKTLPINFMDGSLPQ